LRDALTARSHREVAAAPRRARAKAVEIEDQETLADRVFGLVRTYPAEILVALLLIGAGTAIAWNALVGQTSRHPAPFFGSGRTAPAPLPPLRPLAEAMPPALPALPQVPPSLPPLPAPTPAAAPQKAAQREPAGESARPAEVPIPVARPQTRPAPVTITPPVQQQQSIASPTRTASIGDIIRNGDNPPIPPALVGKVDADRRVSAGQRALAKLGYGVASDGIMGPGTRQAIERFERDRRLPVTGEFTPRTVRELTAASGISVE
jgi:hypothetical protein